MMTPSRKVKQATHWQAKQKTSGILSYCPLVQDDKTYHIYIYGPYPHAWVGGSSYHFDLYFKFKFPLFQHICFQACISKTPCAYIMYTYYHEQTLLNLFPRSFKYEVGLLQNVLFVSCVHYTRLHHIDLPIATAWLF